MIKNNNQGSALVWILVICTIFGILGMAILMVSNSMNTRSINNHTNQQAYFTARSALQTIATELGKDDSEAGSDKFPTYLRQKILENPEKNQEIAFMGFGDTMGNCKVTSNYNADENMIMLTATATKGNMTQTVQAKLEESTDYRIQWPSESEASVINFNNLPSDGLGDVTKAMVYKVTKSTEGTDAKQIDIIKDGTTQAILIYVDKNVKLNIGEISIKSKTNIGIEGSETNIANDVNNDYYPDVFFVLDEGAQLNIERQSTKLQMKLYIYEREPGRASVSYAIATGDDVKKDFFGAIKVVNTTGITTVKTVETHTQNKKYLDYKYISLDGKYNQIETEDNADLIYYKYQQWSITEYIDKNN